MALTSGPDTTTPLLSWRDGQLLRDGVPHRMLAGAVHYFRVHPEQWEDRLRRLLALGANTVDTYVPWNFHELQEGEVSFDGWRDLEGYLRLAGGLGLDVLVRPSPYICAEWSNGGIPSWLTARVRAVRSSDPEFLAAVDTWMDQLIPRLAPLQAAHGGPIVAVQVENEYGSFGSDQEYLRHLADGLRARGIVEVLTTADGVTRDMVANGGVAGALPTFTFGSGVDRARALTRPGEPLICSELWGGWFDHWGEQHHVRSAASMIGTVDELLADGGSVSLYMAHGGTNFGLWAGANHDRALQPTITSYDSDAPIGEDGRLGAKYEAVRASFAPFHDGELPAPPPPAAVQAPQSVALGGIASLYAEANAWPRVGGQSHALPQTFEQLGVTDGMVAYRARTVVDEDVILTVDGLHDRAVVFLNGERVGVLERDGATTLPLPNLDGAEAELTLVVESLGRINYGAYLGEHKGILHSVRVGRRLVHGWSHRALPLGDMDRPLPLLGTPTESKVADGLAVATVQVAAPADAWVALPGSVKGLVWLNGFLLGRYWEIGPQQSLYAPAPLWREGANEIRVLDTDGLGATVEIHDHPSYGPTEEFIGS